MSYPLHLRLPEDFVEKYEKYRNKFSVDIQALEPPIVVGNLTFNKISGDFILGETRGTLGSGTQEFKLMLKLLTSKLYQSKYDDLLVEFYPEQKISATIMRQFLSQIIRNIKEKMKILPKNKNSNPDIFINLRNFGYRIKTD